MHGVKKTPFYYTTGKASTARARAAPTLGPGGCHQAGLGFWQKFRCLYIAIFHTCAGNIVHSQNSLVVFYPADPNPFVFAFFFPQIWLNKLSTQFVNSHRPGAPESWQPFQPVINDMSFRVDMSRPALQLSLSPLHNCAPRYFVCCVPLANDIGYVILARYLCAMPY